MIADEDAYAVSLSLALEAADDTHAALAKHLRLLVGTENEGRRLAAIHRAEAVLELKGFNPRQLRDRLGQWTSGGASATTTTRPTSPQRGRRPSTDLAPETLLGRGTRLRGRKPASQVRYEGGVHRISQPTRKRLLNAFTERERSQLKGTQPTSDLDELYRISEPVQSHFEQILDRGRGIAKRIGADVQSTASEEDFNRAKQAVDANPDGSYVIVAARKGKARAKEKADGKYGGDASKLTDIVRGTVLVPHVDDLPGALDAIRSEMPDGWTIEAPENRFVYQPGDSVNTGDLKGYSDISLLMTSPDGVRTELQVNTTRMWIAKEVDVGHALYERRRAITERAAAAGRDLTPTEVHDCSRLDEQARELYSRALLQSARPR